VSAPKSPIDSGRIPEEAARIMDRMLRMPPKLHEDMKVGKPRPVKERAKVAREPKPSKQKHSKEGR